MSNADASERASQASRARWGSQVPDAAAEIVIARLDEVSDPVRVRLEERVTATMQEVNGDE
jgi:hypothetical protein